MYVILGNHKAQDEPDEQLASPTRLGAGDGCVRGPLHVLQELGSVERLGQMNRSIYVNCVYVCLFLYVYMC